MSEEIEREESAETEDWEEEDESTEPVPEERESVTLEADADADGDDDQDDEEDVDERGVSWKNVAKEAQRKLAEKEREADLASERERVTREIMKDIPRYVDEEPGAAEESKPAKSVSELWQEGKQVEAITLAVETALEKREGVRKTQTVKEKAAGLKEKLIADYPDLADKNSEFFKEVVSAADELKEEWAALGLNVNPAELNRKGLTVVLEQQAVERVVARKPSYRKSEGEETEVGEIKKKTAPGAGKVASGSGKPSGGRSKPKGGKSKIKLSDEQIALRKQYGLPMDDEKLERHAGRVKEYDAALGRGE